MSAFGYKRTSSPYLANVRFTPESGHSQAQERFGLKKQTLNVCFTPKSGHKWLWRGMSAFDPKRTFSAVDSAAIRKQTSVFAQRPSMCQSHRLANHIRRTAVAASGIQEAAQPA
jgi:hypothetical protein